MHNSVQLSSMEHQNSNWKTAVRYWLPWLLLMLGLAYGIHRYFEYRDAQLDKRLEQMG
jgi:hypothetical protein